MKEEKIKIQDGNTFGEFTDDEKRIFDLLQYSHEYHVLFNTFVR